MKYSHLIRALLTSIAASVAVAVPAGAAEQNKISTVTAVYPLADGSYYLSLTDDPGACTSSYTPKRLYVKVGSNSVTLDAAKQMYAALLTALTTDLLVYVVYDDTTANCYVNRLQVYKN